MHNHVVPKSDIGSGTNLRASNTDVFLSIFAKALGCNADSIAHSIWQRRLDGSDYFLRRKIAKCATIMPSSCGKAQL